MGPVFTPEQTATLVKMTDPIHRMEMDRAADLRALTQRLLALTEEVRKLTAAQSRAEEQVGQWGTGFKRLVEAQAPTEERMQELAAALERTHSLVAGLTDWELEWRYQQRAGAYFGPLLRGWRVLFPAELEEELEPQLPAAEFEGLLQVDLLLGGQPRHRTESPLVWLAVEASAVIDRYDVERAQRRAAVLRRAGYRTIPTVAGERITAGAQEEAALAGNILVLQDGEPLYWKEALAAALAD